MHKTADFATLYRTVTRHIGATLTEVQGSHDAAGNALPVEWLRYLTLAFEQQFRDWMFDVRLWHYLEGLERWQGKDVHPAIRLAGHVYLHIGYDLPRSIAVTLGAHRDAMHVPDRSNTLLSPGPVSVPPADRTPARLLFLQVTPSFEEALLSSEGDAVLRRAGLPVMWLRLFGAKRKRAVLEVMAQWAIALRGVAWMHAEILADTGNEATQRRYVERLLVTMQQAQDAITERDDLMDVRLFRAPRLMQIAPLTLFVGDVIATSLTLVILGIWLWLVFRDRPGRIVAAIDALGRETYRRLANPESLADTDSSREPVRG